MGVLCRVSTSNVRCYLEITSVALSDSRGPLRQERRFKRAAQHLERAFINSIVFDKLGGIMFFLFIHCSVSITLDFKIGLYCLSVHCSYMTLNQLSSIK